MKAADAITAPKGERPGEAPKGLSHSRKSAGKRDAIVRAAVEVISAKCFALATMSDIAAALDLRDAALYYYFPNKLALAYACHLRSLEQFEALIDDADEAGGSGLARLERFLRAFLVDAERNGPQLHFGDDSYLGEPEREHLAAERRRLSKRLEGFLKRGMADGSIVKCEPAPVVQLLLGMLVWLGKWAPTVERMSVERLMTAIGAVSLNGLEARPAQG